MATDETLQNLERVRQVATQAGLKGRIDDERKQFQMLFGLPGGRSQIVLARDSSAKGRKVVTFFSPCLEVEKGLLSGLGKGMSIELLRANEKLHFARYGIWEGEESVTVVASCDCLLDTLDPAECHNAAWAVAFAADRFEHEHGQDEF
jgi:hypothetical protein